jgi:DNA primase catalytic subunit
MAAALYYKEKFPYDLIWPIFIRSPHREVAFTVENGKTQSDFFIRYQSTTSGLDLKNLIATKKNLKVIHIGAYYNDERNLKASGLCGVELKFDLDLDVINRPFCCGREKKCCEKCWIFAETAMEVIEYVMVNVYGISEDKIVHVFSGNKGCHTWILEEKFFELKDSGRNTILQNIMLTNTSKSMKDGIYAICKKYYDILKEKDYGEKFCKEFIHDKSLREDILHYFLPKFDENVTKETSHLTKIPLSMHPTTGKIATIIDKKTRKPLSFDESVQFLQRLFAKKLPIFNCKGY